MSKGFSINGERKVWSPMKRRAIIGVILLIALILVIIVTPLVRNLGVFSKHGADKSKEVASNVTKPTTSTAETQSGATQPTLTPIPVVKTTILKLTHDVKIGDILTAGDVLTVDVGAGNVPEGAVTDLKDVAGYKVNLQMPKDHVLMSAEIMNPDLFVADDQRKVEQTFPAGVLPSFLKAGDSMDLVLFKGSSKDEIVLSKVKIITRTVDTLVLVLKDSEVELLKQSLAEGSLYAKAYVNSTQQPSVVTYYPDYVGFKKNNLQPPANTTLTAPVPTTTNGAPDITPSVNQ